MKKRVVPQLPKGFKPISGGSNSWKPEEPGDALEGVLAGVKVVHLEKNGRIPARDVNVYSIKTKDGDVDVWESGGNKALSKIKKGKPVAIVYVGKKVVKKGQQPMREFIVGTK